MTRIAHRWRAAVAALVIAGTAATADAAAAPVRVEVETLRVTPAERRIAVHLQSDVEVSQIDHTLAFAPQTAIAVRPDGRPACDFAPWPDPGTAPLTATSFAFLPNGCTPDIDCAAVRVRFAIAGAPASLPEGSAIYSCDLDVAANAPVGTYPLVVSDVEAFDPDGVRLTADGISGAVIVDQGSATRIEAATVSGLPGTRHRVDVTLRTVAEVVGTDNRIAFDPQTPIAARANGRPDCQLGDDVPRPRGTAFSFTPSDCQPGITCTGMRALVLVLDFVGSIPDGTVLYSCEIDIAAGARPGTYALTISEVGASDPDGGGLLVGGRDGAVIVEALTPTPTETPLPPTATPSATATTPPALTPTRRHDGDGCAVVTPDGPSVWWCMLPLLLVPVRRRK